MAGPPSPLRKYETVIGTIGKTHGVSRAANPQRIASMISAQIEPLPAASFVAGTDSGAGATSAAGVVDAFAAAGTEIVSSRSSGGIQLVSSQIIHSRVAFTAASGFVRRTFWANCALPS